MADSTIQSLLNPLANPFPHMEEAPAPRPKVITLCGSSRFIEVMAVCGWLLEKEEGAVTMGLHLVPGWYTQAAHHLAEEEGVAAKMDALHLQKIDMSDEIFVVNVGHYIGESTSREVDYALYTRKIPVRWFTDDPLGRKVRDIINATPASQMMGDNCG